MTFIIHGTDGLTFNDNSTQKAAARVLQVVHGTYSTQTSSSSNTYADTGLSATITPTSTSSKILVLISHPGSTKSSGNSTNSLFFNLVRNGSQIKELATEVNFTGTALTFNNVFSYTYYDSPASASALTYKTQFKNGNANAQVQVQASGDTSTITLMEIAA
jgi:hypothetical protein